MRQPFHSQILKAGLQLSKHRGPASSCYFTYSFHDFEISAEQPRSCLRYSILSDSKGIVSKVNVKIETGQRFVDLGVAQLHFRLHFEPLI